MRMMAYKMTVLGLAALSAAAAPAFAAAAPSGQKAPELYSALSREGGPVSGSSGSPAAARLKAAAKAGAPQKRAWKARKAGQERADKQPQKQAPRKSGQTNSKQQQKRAGSSKSAFQNTEGVYSPVSGPEKTASQNKILAKKINSQFAGTENLSQKDLRDYLIKNNYFKAVIARRASQYEIRNPIQTLFVIKGSRFFSDQDLQKIIKIDEAMLGINLYKIIEGAIKSAYQKEGFPRAKIKRKIKKRGWKEWVYFHIREGPRLRIAELSVTGFLSKPSSEYSDFIRDNSSPLIKKGFYNKKDLEAGYQKLIESLKGQGYLQSKIYPDRARIEGNQVFIKVTLKEGPLTMLKDIRLRNAGAFPASLVLSRIESKIQSPLRLKILEEDLKKIEDLYKSHGYLKMRLKNKDQLLSYEREGEYAILTMDISEGPQFFVSEISVEGLENARESLVRRLLKFKEGDLLTPKKINQSIKTLSAAGLFSGSSINYETEGGAEEGLEKARAIVSVTEKKPRSIRGGAGLNTERGITARAYGEFGLRNLFGYGRSVFAKTSGQINLKESRPFLEYELSGRYKEVFLPGAGWNGNVSLSRSKAVFTYAADNINFLHKNQISFFIEKKISKSLNLQLNLWNLEARRENCSNFSCPENEQRIGSSSFTLKRDSRDNIFDPLEGALFALTGEAASPYLGSSRDISFWKAHFQSQIYFPLLKKSILALMLKGGKTAADSFLPVSRAFILGGQTSVRGYDGNIEGERIPSQKAAPIDTANEPLRLASGGKARSTQYGLMKLELRFPLLKNVKGLVFYDFGAAQIKTLTEQLTEAGHSAGFGFRYSTFLLPVGLDIGWKLPPKKGQLPPPKGKSYRLHLSIGMF